MQRKIRILTITYTTWREDNNLGNSYSNIFKGMETDLNLHPSILKIQCLKTRCVTNISIFLKRNFLKVFFRESQLVKDFFWRTRWIPQNRNSRQHKQSQKLAVGNLLADA